jgi:hypothetical protein
LQRRKRCSDKTGQIRSLANHNGLKRNQPNQNRIKEKTIDQEITST